MWDRRAHYLENHDGDTVTMLLDQGFHDFKQVNIRLANVWAPESKQEGGLETKLFVADWFKSRATKGMWDFIVFTHRMLKADREQTTFDRYVATVLSADSTASVNSDTMKFIVERGYPGGVGA